MASVMLQTFLADLNRAAASDPVFNAFQLLGGNRIKVLVRGKDFFGTVKLDEKRQRADISLSRRGSRKRIVMRVSLCRTHAATFARDFRALLQD